MCLVIKKGCFVLVFFVLFCFLFVFVLFFWNNYLEGEFLKSVKVIDNLQFHW